MASVPAGKSAVYPHFRVYDPGELRSVFPNTTVVRWFMKKGRFGTWQEVEGAAIGEVTYSEPEGPFPVEAIAFVVCDKGV